MGFEDLGEFESFGIDGVGFGNFRWYGLMEFNQGFNLGIIIVCDGWETSDK
jgi:hypothetical protein